MRTHMLMRTHTSTRTHAHANTIMRNTPPRRDMHTHASHAHRNISYQPTRSWFALMSGTPLPFLHACSLIDGHACMHACFVWVHVLTWLHITNICNVHIYTSAWHEHETWPWYMHMDMPTDASAHMHPDMLAGATSNIDLSHRLSFRISIAFDFLFGSRCSLFVLTQRAARRTLIQRSQSETLFFPEMHTLYVCFV